MVKIIKRMDECASLHLQFVRLGKERHCITYKLLALLPEIYENRIYRDKGFATIEEYAGKLAGLSKGVVQKTLRIGKYLENKPALQKMVEICGIHKVAIVAKLATPETDSDFADKVEHMSKSSLQELSKEVRAAQQGLDLRDRRRKFSVELDSEMEFHLLTLKKRMGNISERDLLKRLLRDAVLVDRKDVETSRVDVREVGAGGVWRMAVKKSPEKKISAENPSWKNARYIPVARRRQALLKTGGRCAYPACNRPPDVFHHRDRFVSSQNHDSIVPLCGIHHDFAHNGLIAREQSDPSNWRLRLAAGVQSETDFRVREYRKLAAGFA